MLVFLSSCQSFSAALMGLNYSEHMDVEKKRNTIIRRTNVDTARVVSFTEAYRKHLDTCEGGSYDLRKSLYQPLQIRVYDTQRVLRTTIANCNVGGFPNLHWEDLTLFDTYPFPRTRFIDSTIVLEQEFRFLDRPEMMVTSASRTPVLVVWATFMGRQSERLLEYTKTTFSDADRFDVWYICADALYPVQEKEAKK